MGFLETLLTLEGGRMHVSGSRILILSAKPTAAAAAVCGTYGLILTQSSNRRMRKCRRAPALYQGGALKQKLLHAVLIRSCSPVLELTARRVGRPEQK